MRIAFISANRKGSWKWDLADALFHRGHEIVKLLDSSTFRRPDRFDLVIWTYFQGRGPRFRPDVAVTMDLWLTVPKRERNLASANPRVRNFWNAEYVFTADGNPDHQTRFANMGVNHYWLPPACPSRLNHWGQTDGRFDGVEVAFVGSRKHWNPLRAEMVDVLAARYGSAFRWYGPYSLWGELRDEDLNDLYASGTIIVGDSMNVDWYWSDRLPRTVGQGGFMLAANVEGMKESGFVEGKTVATWDGWQLDSLIDQIDYYLDNPEKRYKIAAEGKEMVKRQHLWEHRADEICRVVGI